MKKLLAILFAASLLLTSCGGSGGDSEQKKDTSPEEIKLGMIIHLNATEKNMNNLYQKALEKSKLQLTKYDVVYYDNLWLMQMGLESGNVGEISLYNSVANYLVGNNDDLEIVPKEAFDNVEDSFCFAVRKGDDALKNDLNKVIGEMKADGSINKLVTEYITNVNKEQILPKVDLPKFDGAQTIKVGVTGDLPPLDLILPDNSPAGFNTALLAEIAKRLGKNIEIVQTDGSARAAALESNQIDVVFWAILPVGDAMPKDIDKPEGVEFSEPYFKDSVAHLKLKK